MPAYYLLSLRYPATPSTCVIAIDSILCEEVEPTWSGRKTAPRQWSVILLCKGSMQCLGSAS